MSHEHVILTGAELTVENLAGASVYGPDHEKVGVIGDLLLSADETIRSAVIDVGGFLGLGAKHVAVPFETLQFVHDGQGGDIHAHISWTKEELKERQEYVRPDDNVGYTVYAPPLV